MPDIDASSKLELSGYEAIKGCILGTAVGDSLGLPYEGLSAKRITKFKVIPLKQSFFFSCGMLSDDTEHTCMVAQSLIESGPDVSLFRQRLAWRMRWWLLGLPAGIGLATLRSIIKLWLGVSPSNSGVYSAGNGPAMRSAIIGVFAGDDTRLLQQLVTASTCMTHSDPRALNGALLVALAAGRHAAGLHIEPGQCHAVFSHIADTDPELRLLLNKADASAVKGDSALDFCLSLGSKGISGYVYSTVPIVLQVWMRYPSDFSTAMQELISCGGDTDTAAAILGGIMGAGVGVNAIPGHWLESVCDWPRSRRWMQCLATELAKVKNDQQPQVHAPALPAPAVLIRNGFFMLWVLLHGLRRILPPY